MFPFKLASYVASLPVLAARQPLEVCLQLLVTSDTEPTVHSRQSDIVGVTNTLNSNVDGPSSHAAECTNTVTPIGGGSAPKHHSISPKAPSAPAHYSDYSITLRGQCKWSACKAIKASEAIKPSRTILRCETSFELCPMHARGDANGSHL